MRDGERIRDGLVADKNAMIESIKKISEELAMSLGTNSTKFHGEITSCIKEYYLEFSNTEISIHIDVMGRKCINIR